MLLLTATTTIYPQQSGKMQHSHSTRNFLKSCLIRTKIWPFKISSNKMCFPPTGSWADERVCSTRRAQVYIRAKRSTERGKFNDWGNEEANRERVCYIRRHSRHRTAWRACARAKKPAWQTSSHRQWGPTRGGTHLAECQTLKLRFSLARGLAAITRILLWARLCLLPRGCTPYSLY